MRVFSSSLRLLFWREVDRKSCGGYLNTPPAVPPLFPRAVAPPSRLSASFSPHLSAAQSAARVARCLTSCPANFTGEPRWSDRVCRASKRRWVPGPGAGCGSGRACWAWVFGPALWSWRSCSSSEKKPGTSSCSPARTPPPGCSWTAPCCSSATPSTKFTWVEPPAGEVSTFNPDVHSSESEMCPGNRFKTALWTKPHSLIHQL